MDNAMVMEPTEATQICLFDLRLVMEDWKVRIKKFTIAPWNRPLSRA